MAFEREFSFSFSVGNQQYVLRAPLKLPLDQPVAELSHRLIQSHNLMCYMYNDLCEQLSEFVRSELIRCQEERAEESLFKISEGSSDVVDDLLNKWTDAYTKEVLDYGKAEPVSNDLLFSEVYHTLIHSHSLENLLGLEHKYAVAVSTVLNQRDAGISLVDARQRDEMEEAVKKLGTVFTDEQINQFAKRHIENSEMVQSKWASELSNLQESQRREYREWVMRLHEDSNITMTAPKFFPTSYDNSVGKSGDGHHKLNSNVYRRREESFTVHLGAQLKTSHNLRLISCNVLDLCQHTSDESEGGQLSAQRLQTAISLYSNSLCGLVLLVDNRLNSYSGIKREFAKVCEQSTDFHFANLEQQLEQIEKCVPEANDWRLKKKNSSQTEESDRVSLRSSGSAASNERDEKNIRMQSGDFYITRHSNLSEVHTVFHLVTDDSVSSLVSEISSRHPTIMGYRNILKCCFRYDIHTITLPLLLVHEMSEEMTIPWCLKRAELVFKCVKGFIMELAMWSGQESFTIQFLVPKSLSDQTFQSLSNMMPSIFRTSNPVVAKS